MKEPLDIRFGVPPSGGPDRLKAELQTTEPQEFVLEPERYELQAAPLYRFELDRREFFKVLGCGIVVVLFIESALAQESGGGGRRGGRGGGARPMEISAW